MDRAFTIKMRWKMTLAQKWLHKRNYDEKRLRMALIDFDDILMEGTLISEEEKLLKAACVQLADLISFWDKRHEDSKRTFQSP